MADTANRDEPDEQGHADILREMIDGQTGK
jgi:hypothetical protein